MGAYIRRLAITAIFGLAVTVPLAANAAPGVLASKVLVRVVGIARNGQVVKVFADIASLNAPQILTDGHAVRVPVGMHWIGAEVDTPGTGQTIASETLVMRRVFISRSQTVELSAIGGNPVRVSLDAPGATQTSDEVAVCLGGRFSLGGGAVASGGAGTLYAVPVRSPSLTFGYTSQWQGPAARYLVTGRARGGIPRSLRFRGQVAQMAKLTVELRTGTNPGGYNNPILQPNEPCGIGANLGYDPAMTTEYVTAGSWQASVIGVRAQWSGTRRFAAGHSYQVVFGGAVWGPSTREAPQADGGHILFFADSPFEDPAWPDGIQCCDKSSVTLSMGHRVLKHEVLNQWRVDRAFEARAPRAGWYTLAYRAWRWNPDLTIPADLLSRTETVSWRFYAVPSSVPAGYQRELPVRVTRIAARGLGLSNSASPDSTTPLVITPVSPHGRGFETLKRYPVKSVRAFASSDGGKTWQRLRLTKRGENWLTSVQDPAVGFVALRTVVTDTRGNTSTQTIYQAYAIA
jgi:hypothetical protein